MFRNLAPLAVRMTSSGYSKPVSSFRQYTTLNPISPATPTVEAAFAHNGALGGLPEEHPQVRIARIFKHDREVQGWTNGKTEPSRIVDESHHGALGGYAEEYPPSAHIARIYQQQGWNRTAWKIDLANEKSWENNLLGPSYGDTLLCNVSMHMKFKTKEDAIAFCEENNWTFEVEMLNKP
ncbi:hypothetical protein PRIPAC_89801 [Pristionchus pacificus]|uniref:NADH dehydrogenase [ubiquinone] iron-sulfur protein 4, mitochondrial n=1 Tax=Pristionchus pacificus TaxID=54126 RepID=A0A2A6B7S2_PRIPA|nr:hypothetical protein PRIPAC_89801 [Pristionchus pacificus]|eukprot:PDM61911.1 hypothetical protein PRIPAC_51353 [Pristionchus pacificus]